MNSDLQLQTFSSQTSRSSFDDGSAWTLAQRGLPVSAPAGACLLREGDRADSLFLIVEGEVELSRGGRPLETLRSGEFVGLQSILISSASTTSATAVDGARLIRIPRSAYDELTRNPSIRTNRVLLELNRMMARRLRAVSALTRGWA